VPDLLGGDGLQLRLEGLVVGLDEAQFGVEGREVRLQRRQLLRGVLAVVVVIAAAVVAWRARDRPRR
jgi:hypothetical protein